MTLRSKSNKCSLINHNGNALPVVLLFSAIGLIIVFTYIYHQLIIAKPTLYSLPTVQALFNARSGIYKAFDIIVNDSLMPDTVKTIDAADIDFGSDMFDSTKSENPFSETPVDLNLYSSDSFGNCQISMVPKGSFYELISTGKFRDRERKVIAKLGGKIPALPDTVLIIYNELPWDGLEPRGTRVTRSSSDSSKTSDLLESLLSDYDLMLQVFDTTMLDPPLTIYSTREIDKIPDTINGSLIIDGSNIDISWKEKRSILILGDLQITGEVNIRDVSFIVGGEIKFFDKSIIENASIYSKNRIFIGDYAQFSGDAIAMHSITVYNDASVINKSTLVVCGNSSSNQTNDTTAAKNQSDSLKFAIFIEDKSSVDAVCIALGAPGTIRTGTETKITGILWAQNSVCHQGTMSGLIRASKMVDCSVPETSNLPPITTDTTKKSMIPAISGTNKMIGSLTPLSNIKEYRMPCFTDELAIIGWKEE